MMWSSRGWIVTSLAKLVSLSYIASLRISSRIHAFRLIYAQSFLNGLMRSSNRRNANLGLRVQLSSLRAGRLFQCEESPSKPTCPSSGTYSQSFPSRSYPSSKTTKRAEEGIPCLQLQLRSHRPRHPIRSHPSEVRTH